MKFINFLLFWGQFEFWPAWIRIRIPNPDLQTQLNLDPKHCLSDTVSSLSFSDSRNFSIFFILMLGIAKSMVPVIE
jgi:hypothetical protein